MEESASEEIEGQGEEIQEEPQGEAQDELGQETDDEAEPEGEAGFEESKPTLSDDVLSQILDGKSPEELKEISKALGSKAVERYAELTWRAKSAEEKLAEMESQGDPLAAEEDFSDNPYSDVMTEKELKEKARELDQLIEYAEELAEDAEGLDMDDIAGELGGQEKTRREIKQILKESRKARNKYLPHQLEKVRELGKAEQTAKALAAKAKKEFEWLSDESSQTRKVFGQIANNAVFKRAFQADPALAAQLPYFLAHAANSMAGNGEAVRTPAKNAAKKSTRLTPTGPKPTSTAAPSKERNPENKAFKDLQQRFKKTGSYKDRIALRTAQLSKQF